MFVLNRPVAVEHRRQFLRHRAFAAHDGIDPFAYARVLLEKAWVNEVVAAGVGDAVVHDEDFAVVAQVAAYPRRMPQTEGQGFGEFDPGRAQFARPGRAPETLAAECVGKQLAAHAASCCPYQRFQHGIHAAIACDDVKLQQAAMLRGVNIGGEGLQDGVGVGEQTGVVTASRDVARFHLHQTGNLAEARFAQRHGLRRQEAVSKGVVKGVQFRLPLGARPPQFRLANQQV